jgi:hypothetical protein
MDITAKIDFGSLREKVRRAIAPIKPTNDSTTAKNDFLFSGKRAIGASELPAPYLIYFLLVDLLNFKDLGRFEKLAWSIPIDFDGRAFLIEHRKFGVGVFIQDDDDQTNARQIAVLLRKGVRCARPYFKWKAEEAVAASKFNVINNAYALLGRYTYLRNLYEAKAAEAESRKEEVIETKFKNGSSYNRPFYALVKESHWLAIAAIEAFFSWTEHVFVHFAILNGSIQTGADFSEASGAEWGAKFKLALDISDPSLKKQYDKLVEIRRQFRNFIAHGAFGKSGETLRFHSSAGAIPVLLDASDSKANFMLSEGLAFDAPKAFQAVEGFMNYLKTGSREPAWLYVQEFCLPLIMTMAQDGTYQRALRSSQAMNEFAEDISRQMDNAANMDW